MDITIIRGRRQWTFRPLSARARGWFAANYSSSRDLVRPSKESRMVVRTLVAENFDLSIAAAEDRGDFDDHYSRLLIARSKRLAGVSAKALPELVALRIDVGDTVDPRSKTLLPQIDAEIAAALEPGPLTTVRSSHERGTAGKRLRLFAGVRQTIADIEWVSMRVAIMLILLIDLWKIVSELL